MEMQDQQPFKDRGYGLKSGHSSDSDSINKDNAAAPTAHAEEKIIDGNQAFQQAMILETPSWWSTISIRLLLMCIPGFLCSTMNGYDGSLFNALTINQKFLDFFDGSVVGAWQAKVSGIYMAGGIFALPFVGPVLDRWGRRWGMFLGALFVCFGTIVQGLSVVHASLPQFMIGRFIMGFGVTIAASAGPMYVVEISHPATRGVATALYNTFWFVGAIIASVASRAAMASYPTGNKSWLIPVWLQLLCAGLIALSALFLPESPRWLYVNNKFTSARDVLTKYHGNGNPHSIWVILQMREYEEFLNLDGSDKTWWDYRSLFRGRGNRYRIFCNVLVSVCGQWAGNGVLSYFQSAVFEGAGVTGDVLQANLNLANNCQQFAFAILGALLVDRVGRRPLLLFANAACAVIWVGMTTTSAVYHGSRDTNAAASVGTLVLIFLFGSVYSIGFTPLQALYPVEVLSFEMRAKGMAFSQLAVNCAGLLNQFAWPIALERIAWRTYIVFAIWCGVQFCAIWFFIPETKNRTLEQLDEIFESKTPVETSLVRRRLVLKDNGEVEKADQV